MEIFPFDKNNPKNLDPFYKKDLDFFGIIFEGKISYCSSFSQDWYRYKGHSTKGKINPVL